MYLVVTDISFRDPKVRQRFEYTWEDEKRLGWNGPGVEAGLRAKMQVKWLREQGAELEGARVMMVGGRWTPEEWEDEQCWWKRAHMPSCVFVDRPRRGTPVEDSDVDDMQRGELAREAFARGGMQGWNEVMGF
jgi:hypothetical protein